MNTSSWAIPKHTKHIFRSKKTEYCLCIPVVNEGKRFVKQLNDLKKYTGVIDVLILDGGSSDGSTDTKLLKSMGVRALLTKTDQGKLSAQLRIGYAYALKEGYTGVITIDGNGKDDVSEIPLFIKALQEGYDYAQGSRFIKGGHAINTPLIRYFAIRLIHAPLISLAARHWYTDTTNGFRSYSCRYLLHREVLPFRTIFSCYELLAYLSVRASQIRLKVKEVPVTRAYPKGAIPTKISTLGGYIDLTKTLFYTLAGAFNP